MSEVGRKVILSLLLLTVSISGVYAGSARPPSKTGLQRRVLRNSPAEVVAELYRAHRKGQGPFFQTRSRARVDRYFVRRLADLIWADAVRSKGEVGALDGDPLLNTQDDTGIKRFALHPAVYHGGKATVSVTFTNMGRPQRILYLMAPSGGRWKIENIRYSDGYDLLGILKNG